MKKIIFSLFGMLATSAFAGDAGKSVIEPLPGNWEVKSMYEPPAGPLPVPIAPKVTKSCLKKEDFLSERFPAKAMPACVIDKAVIEGQQLKLTMKCASPNVVSAGGALDISSPTEIIGKILVSMGLNTLGKEEILTYGIYAKRIGDCEVPAK